MRQLKGCTGGGGGRKKGAGDKWRGEGGKKHSHQTMLLGEYNVGPGKKPQHIKNSKQLLTIQHQTQNINKQLLVSHIKTQDTTKAWDGGSPEELLCLALNQCFSSQDVIVIPQQVAMEKSLIGSQSESTITRCPKKGGGVEVQSVSQQRYQERCFQQQP